MGTGTPKRYASHTDHLRSTKLATDATGDVVESTDYDSFGKITDHEQTGTFAEKRKFTSHEFDPETQYTYAKARYLDTSVGRFLSQDPAFVALGDRQMVGEKTGRELEQILVDPQAMNSYAYARNNPIKFVDPTGEWLETAADIAFIGYDIKQIRSEGATFTNVAALVGDIIGAAVPLGTGFGAGIRAISGAGDAMKGIKAADKAVDVAKAGVKGAEEVVQGSKLWTPGKAGDSVQSALGHWNDHGSDFPGLQNAKQYVEKAKDFLANPGEGVLQHTRKNGDQLFYDPKTNIYGSMNKGGIPKTFYKPDPKIHGKGTNMDYWKSLLNQ